MERLTEWVGNGPDRKAIARQDYPDIGDKDCVARLAAYEDTGLTPEEVGLYIEAQEGTEYIDPARLRDMIRAELAGRLVVIPSPESGGSAVLAAVFRGDENPIVMHGGGDLDDLIALTHLLVCYTAEVGGVGYADFCYRLGEMPPTIGFNAAKEME